VGTADIRFSEPLYTFAEVARLIDVPRSTLTAWTDGVVTAFPGEARGPRIPFIGLAEALMFDAIRKSGVSVRRIRPALAALESELGLAHVLASKKLYTDGAEVLYDFATAKDPGDDDPALVVVRNGQHVFVDIVRNQLKRVEFDGEGLATRIHVPAYKSDVLCDPKRSFGRPIFAHGGSRVEDVLSRFQSGESIGELTEEFGLTMEEIEDALRVASRRAA
jgi:uncharacterized protein (DUF433 family)